MDANVDPREALLEHTGWLRGLARALVSDPNVADDLTQEACAVRWHKRGGAGVTM